jgi:hypothetical protein
MNMLRRIRPQHDVQAQQQWFELPAGTLRSDRVAYLRVESKAPPEQVAASPTAAAIVQQDLDSAEHRAAQFKPVQPRAGFELLVIPTETRERLLSAAATVSVAHTVFEDWNLKSIEPSPLSAINFYGPPGTGKTLAAHAVASHLGRPLLVAKTSQLESKYHGDSAKNVEALFVAARDSEAVLFLDEADSLLSRRILTPTQGAEHALNAMRSELLLSLDSHTGVVIFATNLVDAYDEAFNSRVVHVRFDLPSEEARAEIWHRHLPKELPLSDDVDVAALARTSGVSGRDIKRAIVGAAVSVARAGRSAVAQADLLDAVGMVTAGPRPREESACDDARIAQAVARQLREPLASDVATE